MELFPLFSSSESKLTDTPRYLTGRIDQPSYLYATSFVAGTILRVVRGIGEFRTRNTKWSRSVRTTHEEELIQISVTCSRCCHNGEKGISLEAL